MSDNLITISIDDQEFKYWTTIRIDLNIDSFKTFEFTAPFEPEKSKLREFFQLLRYKLVEIKIDDELFLSGTLINVVPGLTDSNIVTCAGYAKPGILNDVSYPFDKPKEFNNQTLQQIAETVAGYYQLQVAFTENSGAAFDRVDIDEGKPLDFLITLAKKRGFILTDNEKGDLLFTKAVTAGNQTELREGHTPLQSVTPRIDSQKFYSEITGLLPGILGGEFEAVTVKNPFSKDVYRPFVYSENQDLDPADLEKSVKAKMNRMFADAVSYDLEVVGLRDQFEQIWKPNAFINLYAPRVMIYNEFKFLVKSVQLNKSGAETSTLNLVLPESYTDKLPESLPWLE